MGGKPRRPACPPQVWLGLGFVLIVFVVLAATIAVKTPAWESNDEPDHVQNIETLVAGHWYGMHVSKLRTVVLRHIDRQGVAPTGQKSRSNRTDKA
jgi:hypothetical protein